MDLELTTDEWLDFLRLLRKCQVEEWVSTGKRYYDGIDWDITISRDIYDSKVIGGFNKNPPPNWAEFLEARVK